MRSHALRLRPGEDLRLVLQRTTEERELAAVCVVTCVGSLAHARLRLAGGEEVLELDGPLEIVALVGTCSGDGPHLHIALADARGEVRGGHVLAGCIVHTTAEVVLGELEGVRFARELDAATGWKELVVRALERDVR
ncbi:MAG: DNA-binding protein [Planctomycetes bacterium]|nr:DNA-binding protein [Planctomycetota bacterium]